ncbi:MAG TPA: GNAT family N-acetyltransferase, partial [Ignavibacteriaceae bacterium]|nr:GNAT family N-acetyltransferase [Ignavibacteriaceae bacterium]
WNNITKKARQNIRKAQSSNITVVTGNEYLDDFYELMANNMKLLGTPVHSKSFYQAIIKKFNGDAELFIAKQSGKTISVALTIKFGKYIFGYSNAAHPDYLSYKPNFLIYWEIIKSAVNSSYELFDLGRSLNNSGTFTFKQNFGAYPVQLYYDYYLNKINTIPAINQDNNKLKLATNIWSHLPLGITKMVGPHLIKYVA